MPFRASPRAHLQRSNRYGHLVKAELRPMVAKAEDLVASLESADSGTRLKAIRDVKNQVIGNRQRKRAFIKLDAIPRIVELLSSGPDSSLLVQCAAVVGSLARVDQASVKEVSSAGAIAPLLRMLDSEEEPVIEAGLRALSVILFGGSGLPDAHLLKTLNLASLLRVVGLLKSPKNTILASAVKVVSACAYDKHLKQRLLEIGTDQVLVSLVEGCETADSVSAAAVKALSFLLQGSWDSESGQIGPCLRSKLMSWMRTHHDVHVRLDCSACLMWLSIKLPNDDAQDTRRACLAALIKLPTTAMDCQAIINLGQLLAMDASLCASARDSTVVPLLAGILRGNPAPDLQVAVLDVLAMLTDVSQEGRRLLVETDVVGGIVQAFQDNRHRALQASACCCLRNLSRSAAYLRQLQSWFKQCVPTCLALIAGGQRDDIQASACALLSNLLLDFSPARESAISAGCIQLIARHVDSKQADVKYASLFALANLTRHASISEKQAVMAALGSAAKLNGLLTNGTTTDMEVRALIIMQNLTADCTEEELHTVLRWWLADSANEIGGSGQDLNATVSSISTAWGLMDVCVPGGDAEHHKCRVQTPILRILNNMAASGGPSIRRSLIRTGLLDILARFLPCQRPEVVSCSLWIIHNLCKWDDPDVAECIVALREKKLLEEVKRLEEHSISLDVRERASQVLQLVFPESSDTAMQET